MKSDNSIEVCNISKIFNKNVFGTKFFIDELRSFFNPKLKKELELKNQIKALNNISFNIKTGQKVALIGNNGSGKSTFLRILSGITIPSSGEIFYKGKVISILEQGIGFNGEMTAHDNIYLNAVLLGSDLAEIRQKIGEIVDFADLNNFQQTPIKRYSSGMKTRLGISIALHIRSDILLIDEVLAVGDQVFRTKCIDKLFKDYKETTIIFVSHEMELIYKMCDYGILIDKGQKVFEGEIKACIDRYQTLNGL